MIQKLVLVFSCFFIVACSEKKVEQIPANILSKEKMAELLLDVHLLESAISINTISIDKSNPDDPLPTFNVLKKHHVSKQTYDSSFVYYADHPNQLSEIYQEVLDSLSRLQANVQNEKSENDTIIKVNEP